MTLRTLTIALATLAMSAGHGLALAAPAPARAEGADSSRFMRSTAQVPGPHALELGRAALARDAGDPRGVIENLEGIDFSVEPPFAEADGAAFLLGEAYLELGDGARFATLARNVARWKRESVYTRGLAGLLQLLEAGRSGSGSADSMRVQSVLAAVPPGSPLGRDLAGAEMIRRATRAMAAGEDGREWLERVPAGSRYASRARHMLGLQMLERGDTSGGAAALESLAAGDSTYDARREVMLALAGRALDQGRWESAHAIYRAIDADWARAHGGLERLLDAGSFDRLWSDWNARPGNSGMVVLDAQEALLRARGMPPSGEPDAAPAPSWPVAPPPAEAWSAVDASASRLAQATAERERSRWALSREREQLADRRRYLDVGHGRVEGEKAELVARKAMLDSLRRTLEGLDLRLRSVRDAERQHVALRARRILEACEGSLLWLRAMRHYSIEGPDSARVVARPDGYPGPDSLWAGEEALAQAIQACAESLAAGMPGRLARSYALAWRPGLIDRAATQGTGAAAALGWAQAIGAAVDSGRAATRGSETQRRLEARNTTLTAQVDSLRRADDALRALVARRAVRRALAALDDEREAIDYGLAASAWAVSVRLGASDSLGARTAADGGRGAGADSLRGAAGTGEEPIDAEAARWRAEAIPLLTSFLARHPRSPARAEMRFRLADLECTDDREAFRAQMAEYTRRQAAGEARGLAVPVLSHTRALALYRRILDEDHDFNHRDAVLFNAGMIQADAGDPGAAGTFHTLVSEHPQSPYCQEAYLRMGDMEFNLKRFLTSVTLYGYAAQGTDPTLRTIAFYKMGWAHYSEDRFPEAADAFRAVLDLYASPERGAIKVEIEGEAEAYLVHSLAGGGGAPLFAATFDAIGPRPYERRVLMALGQHYRRYGEYPNAAAADQLWLRRYPTHPDALVIAQRLVETYTRSNRPALERDARLTLAPRFAPGGEWSTTQASDSVRAAGSAFARSSWLSVALDEHKRARATGAADAWREAARLYETVIEHWPDDPGTPALELATGEADAQLKDYTAALRHYDEAARSGPDSIASIAMWQRVAVTDAWYERTRPAGAHAGASTGSDSLAKAVLEAGDQLLARFPDHARGADIVWRQSQLGLAHGWRERAVQDLARMTARYPDDPRAPLAACQRGDALYRLEDFEAAGAAFEEALAAARRVGRDSLARVAARAIPVCYYRGAEAAAAADSTAYERNAQRFEQFATRFPQYPHAHVAQYRAGLAYARGGRQRDAVRAMQALLDHFPASPYAREARLQIAKSREAAGERELAALAYVEFARQYPDDESAGAAWLKAADLDEAAGQAAKADTLRLTYIRKYPGDVETAMTILEGMSRRELAGLAPGQPISTLLGQATVRRRGAPGAPGLKRATTSPAASAAPASRLADYMRRAAAHPALASRDLMAQVRFLQGEEAHQAYLAARLSQPLTASIPIKKRLLDTLLVRYRRTVDLGVPQWAHAAAFRIGAALVEFGDALEHSERPADLRGEDLRAYEGVLGDQARAFSARGEDVWADLLRKEARGGSSDDWTAQAQSSLWQRLSNRFLYLPEAEYPLVNATPPPRVRDEPRRAEGASSSRRRAHGARSLADRERPE